MARDFGKFYNNIINDKPLRKPLRYTSFYTQKQKKTKSIYFTNNISHKNKIKAFNIDINYKNIKFNKDRIDKLNMDYHFNKHRESIENEVQKYKTLLVQSRKSNKIFITLDEYLNQGYEYGHR